MHWSRRGPNRLGRGCALFVLCVSVVCAGAHSSVAAVRGEAASVRGSDVRSPVPAPRPRMGRRTRRPAASAVTGTITVNGAAVTMTVSTAGDTVRLTFDGTAGATLGLGVSSNTFAWGPTVKLLDAGGAQVGSSQILSSSGNTGWNLPVLPATGSYTIVFIPSASGTGTATFTLSDDLVVSSLLNGSSATVAPRSGQNIRIPFSGSANERLGLGLGGNLDLGSCPNYCTIKLLDGSGAQVGSGGYMGSQYTDYNLPALPASGSYTLFLDLGGQTNMSLTLTLSDDLVVSGLLNGSSATVAPRPGQNVRIPFSGTANEHVGLGLGGNLSLSSCSNFCTVKLLDGSGVQVGSGGYVGNQYTDYNLPALPANGSYTLVLDLAAQTSMSLTLTLSDDLVVSNLVNGSPATLAPRAGQNVRVPFTGTAGEHLGLGMGGNVSLGSCANFCTVKLLDGSGAQVGSGSYVGSPYTDYNLPTVPANGSYTLLLDLAAQTNMSLTLTLSDDLVQPLSPYGPAASLTLARVGQNVRFTFYGGTAEPLLLSVTNNTIGCCPTVKLLDGGDNQVGSGGTLVSGNTSWNLPSLPSNGSYTIFYDPKALTGAATFKLSHSAPYEPPEQSWGGCGGAGRHGLSPSFCLADPVNSLTGAYTTSATDLSLPGIGVSFAFTRSYTSADPTVGRLGVGWTDSYSTSLTILGNGDIRLHGEDGQQLLYSHQADGSYSGAGGARSTLSQISGGYKLVTHDQVTYQFDSQGVLQSIRDRNSQGVTLSYTSGRLTGVTDASGRTATLSYNGSGLVSAVSVPDGRSVGYAYTNGRLTGVTDVLGHTTSYSYDSGGRLATETDPLGHTAVSNVYDGSGRVSQQTDATGHTTSFAWNASTQTATATDPRGNSWKDVYQNNVLIKRIDALGNTTQFGYDIALDTTSVTAPDGAQTTLAYDVRGNLATATAPASLGAQRTFSYNSGNDVTATTDARGKTTNYTYDGSGNLTLASQLGQTIAQTTYNSAGQPVTSTDGRGDTTSYAYDSAGNLISATDAAGDVTTYTYDAAGRRTSRVDPLGNVSGANPDDHKWTYTYDGEGHLLTETDPLGKTTTHSYDAAGNEISVTDARNHTTTYAYDAANRLTSMTAPGGGVTSYTYDTAGNQLTVTDANNHTTTSTYDADNRLISVTKPSGAKATYAYDTKGNLIKRVDPRGNASGANPDDYATSYTYDAAGRVLTETDPLGHTTTYTYDAVGNRTSVKDANNHTTTYTYDSRGRLASETSPTGGTRSNSYDGAGNLATTTDPNNRTTGYSYDAANRRTSETTPSGSTTTYTYDRDGNLTTIVDPRGNVSGANPADHATTQTYDADGRLLTSTDPLASVTTFAYDAVGNRLSVTDPDGNATTYAYDALNRLVAITAPDLSVTGFSYDPAGNLTSKTDADNHTTTYAYDADDQLTSITSPAGQHWTNAYDLAGNLTSTIDANGNSTPANGDGTTTYSYDAANRLTAIDYSDLTPDVQFGYDAAGNRTSMSDGAGTQTYGYDTSDRLTQRTRGPDTFSYQYDAAGNVTRRTYPDGTIADYTYTPDERLAAVTSAGETTNYAYDPAGNLQQTTLPASNGYAETRTYDRANRLIELKNANGASVLDDFVYTLDPAGNPTKRVVSGQGPGTTTYSYDSRNRLTAVCFQLSCPGGDDPFVRWTYDAVGNRVTEQRPTGTTSYSYNAADELTQAGSTTYSYDQNGNQTAAGDRTFTYDLANRLVSTTRAGATTTYTYDGVGNRLQASSGAQPADTTNYLWDENGPYPQLALERDGAGSLIRRYLYGTSRISMTSGGNRFYYHYDGMGSVSHLTSASGTSEWSYDYEPFGASRVEAKDDPAAPDNPMRFDGQLLDATGLYDLRAREYDPQAGRFLQVDPVPGRTDAPIISSYAYVADQPTVLIDPTGRTFEPSDAGTRTMYLAASPTGQIGVGGGFAYSSGWTSPAPLAPCKGGGCIEITYSVEGQITAGGTPHVSYDNKKDVLTFSTGDFNATDSGLGPLAARAGWVLFGSLGVKRVNGSSRKTLFEPAGAVRWTYRGETGTFFGNDGSVTYDATPDPPKATVEAHIQHRTTPMKATIEFGYKIEITWVPRPQCIACVIVPLAVAYSYTYSLAKSLFDTGYYGPTEDWEKYEKPQLAYAGAARRGP